MDDRKPSISPSERRLQSAPEWTSADIEPPPADLSQPGEFIAVEEQSPSVQAGSYRNDPPDGPPLAVYYRNEEEVRDGFLIALRAMGAVADVEQLPEPVIPPVRGAKS